MSMPTIRCRVTPMAYRALEELADAPTPDAVRARIVLAVLAGVPPAALARQAGVPRTTVYSWVRRFAATGIAGLCHRSPRGSPIGPAGANTAAEGAPAAEGARRRKGIGAVAGGLVGARTHLGVDEQDAREYEAHVKQGSILLTVHADSAEQAEQARTAFEGGSGGSVRSYPVPQR